MARLKTTQVAAKIADELLPLAVPLADLQLDEQNTRYHGARSLRALQAALQRFGQRKPVVISKDKKIIAGNGLATAARALGWEAIAAVVMDASEEDQRAFAIADNRTAELSSWDYPELSTAIELLQQAGDDMEALGFSAAELEQITLAEWRPGAVSQAQAQANANLKSVRCHENELSAFKKAGELARARKGETLTDGQVLRFLAEFYLERAESV